MINLILINDVLKNLVTKRNYIVSFIDQSRDLCYLVEVETVKLTVVQCEYSCMNRMIEQLQWTISDESTVALNLTDRNLTEAERELLEKRWRIISYILERSQGFSLYIKRHRTKIIKEASAEFEVSENSVRKYLRLFLQGGKLKASLLPKLRNCGARGQERKYVKKPGAKHFLSKFIEEDVSYSDVVMDEFHKKNIRMNIDRRLKNKKLSITNSYNYLIRDFYSYTNDIGERVPYAIKSLPTLRQYRYQVEKYRKEDPAKFQIMRQGEREYDLGSRPLLSSSILDAFGPGFRYEIDATRPFIFLVDSSRQNEIGTPVVYYVVDVYSKVIIGFYIGLEAASSRSASMALLSCIENKVELCKRNGVEIKSHEWFVEYLPQNILADRGEFAGLFGGFLSENFGISVENTPSFRGDMKGTVEKAFDVTERDLLGVIPGYEQKNFRSRGEIDGRKRAKLTIGDLREIYIRKIIEHNNSPMKYYRPSYEMVQDKLILTPNNVWQWGVKHKSCGALKIDYEVAKYILMEEGNASITEKGLIFEGLQYTSSIAEKEGWFSEARRVRRKKVKIRYDARNLREIMYREEASGKLIVFAQTAASSYEYGDISMSELLHHKKLKRIAKVMGQEFGIKEKVRVLDQISKKVELVEKENLIERGVKKPSSKNKRENRDLEKIRDEKSSVFIKD